MNAKKLQGRDISTAAPTSNQVLTYNDVTSKWEPKAPGVPGAHASTHQDAGSDEIVVTGLSGELADNQPPKAHAASHQNGGGDEISVAALSGVLADKQDADKLQARNVEAAAPADGEVLTWVAASSEWQALPGAANGSKVMNLSPEYPGMVAYPDGANNNCIITSGHDQASHRNYIEITALAATNDYDLVIEVRVPTSWTWNSAKIFCWTDDKANVTMAVEIFDTTGTTDGSDTVTPLVDNTWEEKSLTTPAGTYASEGLFHVHLKGTIAAAGKKARFGAILLKSS